MNIITESIEKVAYELGPAWTSFPYGLTLGMWSRGETSPDCVGNGTHIIRVTEDEGNYFITVYQMNHKELARIRVSSGSISESILLLAN